MLISSNECTSLFVEISKSSIKLFKVKFFYYYDEKNSKY